MPSVVQHIELGELRRHLRERLQAVYGDRFRKVHLFGSRARGEARAGSDVDVLVVLAGSIDPFVEYRRLGDLTVEMMERFGAYVSPIVVDEKEYREGSGPLLNSVRDEGVTL